ncbi:MAG: type VI secretion system baseplate subunit TssG [Bacteroidota bacterium]
MNDRGPETEDQGGTTADHRPPTADSSVGTPSLASGDAAPAGPEATRRRMEADAHQFGFFQAVRLLAAARGGPHTIGGPSPRDEAVRVSPDPASVFPASDVRHVDARGSDEPAQMEVGFGGLYGVDAALPTAFHEHVTSREAWTEPLRDFLDLLGHRSYAQLWRAWAKYRPEVRAWSVGRDDSHASRAAALTGIASRDDRPVETRELLPFAARLSGWARNAEGLRALLEHGTGHPVRVVENVPRLVRLGDRPRLGATRLGIDAVVGERIYDESGKFRLEIGPLGRDGFRALLPGRHGATRVAALVRLYTSDTLDYDVDLLLRSEEAPPLVLGDTESARLGRNAHLGTPQTPLVRRRVRYAAA